MLGIPAGPVATGSSARKAKGFYVGRLVWFRLWAALIWDLPLSRRLRWILNRYNLSSRQFAECPKINIAR